MKVGNFLPIRYLAILWENLRSVCLKRGFIRVLERAPRRLLVDVRRGADNIAGRFRSCIENVGDIRNTHKGLLLTC